MLSQPTPNKNSRNFPYPDFDGYLSHRGTGARFLGKVNTTSPPFQEEYLEATSTIWYGG